MTSTPEPMTAEDLERFRAYLNVLARAQVSPALRDRLDLSGVVQQTLLEAVRGMSADPRGRTEDEAAAWLRAILGHNLADGLRRLNTQKRDVRRVRSLTAALDQSSARLADCLADGEPSPSRKLIHHERMLAVARALEALPENQRRAVEMHHLQGMPLAEIAAALGTTRPAVAGLLHRGLKALRANLDES
ncbi:RNA polymerase sigma factor [Aquisphaera giovannonii]|uniref:RNA polymerase sigma factor n=1 Tax=Aquisphaera giovannonii TaxID=406548 RepID=A0A5B9WAG2_9BACT|nr:sigma-70 family RNA polymerase sigma factor [Aquisphaera giovannonii]QEH37229.1 RNA polymerase sigma factor [Aquisphaera giovannonii]